LIESTCASSAHWERQTRPHIAKPERRFSPIALSPFIEKFRNGKAEHNDDSLRETLAVDTAENEQIKKELLPAGFLAHSRGSYKIPILYRAGLQITQGKVFPQEEAE
jgi:hypothetical protein